ncbi:MAG TPA: response regulator [Arsenicitalea sp.]|nr:response regulator [Arsenicitalea sp.]
MPSHLKPSVLIVEDEPLIAIDTEDLVKDLGYEVIDTAGSVCAALEALSQRRPDIVLLDVLLRSETSLLVAERCRSLGIGLAFTTGFPARDLPVGCGDAPVLAKPFSAEELRRTLHRVAEARPKG